MSISSRDYTSDPNNFRKYLKLIKFINGRHCFWHFMLAKRLQVLYFNCPRWLLVFLLSLKYIFSVRKTDGFFKFLLAVTVFVNLELDPRQWRFRISEMHFYEKGRAFKELTRKILNSSHRRLIFKYFLMIWRLCSETEKYISPITFHLVI